MNTTRLDVHVRPCVAGDGAALALVGQATFLETFAGILGGDAIVAHCAGAHSADLYHSWLAGAEYALWLAEASPGNAPVGYMVVAPPQLPLADTSHDLELKRIYLLSRFHGGGLGRQLVADAVAHARSRGARRLLLGVYAHNHPAIAFYERAGFSKIGTRKFNVGGRDYDDHIMGMSLGAANSSEPEPVDVV
jgi:ribosomal protein S18 acetylase RimI-like enzyme